MKQKTHLMLTRYVGEGIFLEDSEGNEEFFTADSYGCFNVDMSDGQVNIAVTENRKKTRRKSFQLDVFAPRDVTILREELL